jgi:hypothetical protein
MTYALVIRSRATTLPKRSENDFKIKNKKKKKKKEW